jgi:hypothetical protein
MLLPLILGLEVWAFLIYRDHPLGGRPPHFHVLTLLVQFLMVWTGVESARWLLRSSAASRASGPFSDLTRLWVWLGPFGGLFLGLACLGGHALSQTQYGVLSGFLLVAHFSGGALLWCLGSAWTIPAVFADSDVGWRDRGLALAGMLSHTLGFAAYALIFPAERTPLRGAVHPALYLILSSLIFCYLTFYVYANVVTWSAIFRVWRPRERE